MRYEENPGGGEKIVLIGIAGLAAWWIWSNFFATAAPVAAPATSGTPSPAATTASTWTLANLYAAMIAMMKAANDSAVTVGSDGTVTASPDVFDWYLQHVTNSPVPNGPPVAFSDHGTPITSTDFWAGMAPLLTAQLGLSGGQFFSGLGCVCDGLRGAR